MLIDLNIFKLMIGGETSVPQQANDVNTGTFTDIYDGWTPACSRITEFMRAENYKNPISKDNTIWKFGTGSDLPYFTWMQTQDERQRAFANHMKFKSIRQNWYDTVTLNEIFPEDFNPKEVLIVDVGGNAGHDLLGFSRAHPKQPGRLILQDLPGQIQPLDKQELSPIEPMCHDFFTPQPVKGAKAYYLKMVLHDWPDSQCREILNNLKPALVPGFSKILINEIVVLDYGADWFSTSVDMIMMIFHSSWERREKQWRELIESVGLKVTRIWPCGGAPEKLIEVELA
ncbi:S-adenosyl-L-methionine-dependent methyltransferase [Diaporthe amygdali]|uniref:S-adenosyl-L-methionine-dependent methyltransferase n=1 Tax=Phomopsis amygdali TaxID=1214568 RepID=UPI0022FEEB4C|nr:S-adenosyl-L-methionine-dependent methyltransferase [Diaporthe amygdali]KAJ0118604.1 S-adenosyl-L-methionine-dependent methyltransferase [Diaporthe amygdali]